jgi:predicted regulator of Ras-like GTPase activity (Roadblock/LC7/MglB family)
MPYQRILDALLRENGVQAAMLLDIEGERVVEAGTADYRHRLIGAYQGIALTTAQRTAQRYETGDIRYILCRYSDASVIVRPLRDGYYLLVSLSSDAELPQALHRSETAQDKLNEALTF